MLALSKDRNLLSTVDDYKVYNIRSSDYGTRHFVPGREGRSVISRDQSRLRLQQGGGQAFHVLNIKRKIFKKLPGFTHVTQVTILKDGVAVTKGTVVAIVST